jgi:hypothetical protein
MRVRRKNESERAACPSRDSSLGRRVNVYNQTITIQSYRDEAQEAIRSRHVEHKGRGAGYSKSCEKEYRSSRSHGRAPLQIELASLGRHCLPLHERTNTPYTLLSSLNLVQEYADLTDRCSSLGSANPLLAVNHEHYPS